MGSYREPKTKTHTFRHLRGQGNNGKTVFPTHSAQLIGNLYEVLKKSQYLHLNSTQKSIPDI